MVELNTSLQQLWSLIYHNNRGVAATGLVLNEELCDFTIFYTVEWITRPGTQAQITIERAAHEGIKDVARRAVTKIKQVEQAVKMAIEYRNSSGAVFWSSGCEDAVAAINFALDDIEDHHDRFEFLKSWREGDVAEWPEFLDKVKK